MKPSKYLLLSLGLIVGSALFAQTTTTTALLNDSFASAPTSPVTIAASNSTSVMGQNLTAAQAGALTIPTTGPTAQWFPNGATSSSSNAVVYTNAASAITTGTLLLPSALSQSVTTFFVPFNSTPASSGVPGYQVLNAGDALTMTATFSLGNASPQNNTTALKFGLFNSGSTTGVSNQSTRSTGNNGSTTLPNRPELYSGYYCAVNPNQTNITAASVLTLYSRPALANTTYISSTTGFTNLGSSSATASFTNNTAHIYKAVLTVYRPTSGSMTVTGSVYDTNISTTTPMTNYTLTEPSAQTVTSFDGLTIGDNFNTTANPQTLYNVAVTYTPVQAMPTFTPVAGTYTAVQSVSISTTASGLSIAYTTDGTTPAESAGTVTNGTLYSGAISVGASTTLNAISFTSGTGGNDSAVSSAAYTINFPQASAPTFSPVAGTYSSAQSVAISSTSAGASISYTTDGSTPTETHGTVVASGGTVSVNVNTTLKAIAFESGVYTDSTVATSAYIIQASAPSFSPVAGTYTAAQTVTISSTTGGASISYTTDGSTPTETNGTVVASGGTVSINATTTLQAIAFVSGFGDSPVSSGSYILQPVTPTFSPVAGTYTVAQSVTISSATAGASIVYTTDGSTPTETGGTVGNGTLLANGGTVLVGATETLTAIAFQAGWTDSTAAAAAYTINIPVASAPSFSPVAGTYTVAQDVTITSATSGASIRYTTDGVTTPTETVGTLYTGPVNISSTATLQAIAYKSGFTDSSVTSGTYTINIPVAAAPTFSPVAGTYTVAQSVTISSTTGGASIRYTTDGSTPTATTGTVYSSPVSIGSTATLKAIAYEAGFTDSSVTSGTYTINIPVAAAPTFSPVAGTFTAAQSVTISSTTGGASIRYTTDGSTPTSTTGTLYTGAVSISTSTTLQAIAYEAGFTDSSVTSGSYVIQVVAPVFSPVAGTYTVAQDVTITSATSGASIRYTTDGSIPTATTGTVYTIPVNISATTTLKAIAYEAGLADSTVTSGVFTIGAPPAPVDAPTFSPVAGTYTSAQTVTISSTTGGASISYTTDGSTPTETHGTVFASGGTVSVSVNLTLQAIAFESGLSDSTVTSGAYVIQVVAPVFSPVAGTYTAAQSVTISTTTGGASIRYTTDGSTPTSTTGTVYSSPVSIGSTATLQAIAYESGLTDSSVTSGTYTINIPVAAAPTFSPVAGTYTAAQSVTISTTTGGASIRYTTDGSTPTATTGTVYSSPVSISSTATLKAIAYESGFIDSSVTSGTYTINIPVAAAPTFSPVAGTFTAAQSVTISSTTGGASIRYTTDGSTPTSTTGTLYAGAVSISTSLTLKAIAYEAGFTDSSVTSGSYVIQVVAPAFSPVAGTYTVAQSVTISSTTGGASIRYTTDGSTPTATTGTVYSSAVSISATTTLKAIAFKAGLADSSVTSGVYTINIPVAAAPTFSPVAGTYTAVQSVTISTTTGGASIRYTMDGSTPTSTTGTVYSSPVSIGSTATLKAIAYEAGFTDSSVTSGVYTINLPVAAAPTFSPVAGTYTAAQLVTITSTTGGVSIRYTTDGSTPTSTTGTVYSSPVSIGSTATLKAIAYEAGFTDSSVTSGAYAINLPGTVSAPVFSPAAGSFTSAQSVSITSTTGGASIRYTLDGSSPSQVNGTLYSGPVAIAATTTLKAIAYEAAFLDSSITSGTYTILLPTAAPTFSPAAGTYTSVQSVALATTTSGASICYTTDGSTPTESNGTVTHGTLYSGPISVGATMTISAITFKTGSSDSSVATAAFTIAIPPPPASSGGAFDDWFLGALAAAGIVRWRFRKKTG